jgi:hypothetical protein
MVVMKSGTWQRSVCKVRVLYCVFVCVSVSVSVCNDLIFYFVTNKGMLWAYTI